MLKLLLASFLVFLTACIMPFELGPKHQAQAARAKAESTSPSASTSSSVTSEFLAMSAADCTSLDRERMWLTGFAGGLGAIGGANGIALPATGDKTVQLIEGVVVVVSAVGALILGSVASSEATKFTKECSQ